MVRDAIGAGNRFRRHVPPLLFLIALTLMIVAIARPAAVVTLPSQHETIILAMDVSGSMRATDVEPNRLTAAQEAAQARSSTTSRTTRASASCRSPAPPPSCSRRPQNREDMLAAIDRFSCSAARRSAAASWCR